MSFFYKRLASLALAAVIACTMMMAGCTSSNRYYRAHDGYYNDNHVFTPGETVYYRQWEGERRLQHREFRERNREQQHAYFDWRHSHHDNDHDRH